MCLCLLAAVFTTALLGLRHVHPRLNGVGTMALGFSLGIPATILLAMDRTPRGFTEFVDVACVCLCYIFFYLGILRFLGKKGHMRLICGVAGLTMLVVLRALLVSHKIVPAIVGVSSTIGLAQALIAKELFLYAKNRNFIRLFAISMSMFATMSFTRSVLTILRGAPSDYMKNNSVQTSGLIFGVLFVCVEGILCLAMLVGEVNRAIEEQAQLDYVTGALNRRGIEEAMMMELARSRRSGRPISILLIDVDRFKAVNDVHGHVAGDEALRAVVRSIAPALRLYDRLGRYGGDEFLLLLPETRDDDAMVIAERIREALARDARDAGFPMLTVSIGVTSCAWGEEVIEILGRADAALYEAKRQGRDCARIHRPDGFGGEVALTKGVLKRGDEGRGMFGFFL